MSDNNNEQTTELFIEAKRQFNEFQSQSRARMESTIKLILVVSGGMLTLSVGAVLGKVEPNIPPELIPSLKCGWGLLFYSIAASLFLMFTTLVATYHMGVKWFSRLAKQTTSTEAIKTWGWLRIFNVILGVTILLSCISGIGLMARVANGVASGV